MSAPVASVDRGPVVRRRLALLVVVLLIMGVLLLAQVGLTVRSLYRYYGPDAAQHRSITDELEQRIQADWDARRWGPLTVVESTRRCSDDLRVGACAEVRTAHGQTLSIGTVDGRADRLMVFVQVPLLQADRAARAQAALDAGAVPPGVGDGYGPEPELPPGARWWNRFPMNERHSSDQRLASVNGTLLLLVRNGTTPPWSWQVSGPYDRPRVDALMAALNAPSPVAAPTRAVVR